MLYNAHSESTSASTTYDCSYGRLYCRFSDEQLKKNQKNSKSFNTLFSVVIFIFVAIFESAPSTKERSPTGELKDFPMFFGTTLFALVASGVVISLENNMKSPESFASPFGVLNCGMTFVTIVYILFGLFGYLKYGKDIKESITFNLNSEQK